MFVRQLLILGTLVVGTQIFGSEIAEKFERLYELQSLKAESRKLLDKYLDAIAAQLVVESENVETFKNEVFEKWYTECKRVYADVYSKNFTEADVDQMIAYAESDLGRKLASKQQSLSFEIMPVYQSVGVIATETAVALRNK
jgi:hypothetical protein